jgi:hypothetical protein
MQELGFTFQQPQRLISIFNGKMIHFLEELDLCVFDNIESCVAAKQK